MKNGKIKISIRKARKTDRKAVRALFRELYTGDEKAPYYKEMKLDPTGVKFSQRLLIAEAESNIVGFCWAMCYEHVKNKGVATIEELVVDSKFRSLGIGKKLVDEAVSYARKEGMLAIFVTSDKEASGFYKKLGFKHLPNYFVKALRRR